MQQNSSKREVINAYSKNKMAMNTFNQVGKISVR